MLESNQQPCPRAKGQSKVAQHPSLSSFQCCSPPRSESRRLVLCSQGLWGWQVKKFHWGRGNEIEFNLEVICLPRNPRWSQVTAPVPMVKLTSVSQLLGTCVQWRFWCIRFNMVQTYWAEGKKKREPNSFGDFVWIYKKAGLKPAEYL